MQNPRFKFLFAEYSRELWLRACRLYLCLAAESNLRWRPSRRHRNGTAQSVSSLGCGFLRNRFATAVATGTSVDSWESLTPHSSKQKQVTVITMDLPVDSLTPSPYGLRSTNP